MKRDDLKYIKLLGQGGYGAVYLAEILTGDAKGRFKAVKSQDVNYAKQAWAVEKEVAILESIKGVLFCTQIEGHFTFEGSMCVVMNYYPGGSLEGFLGEMGPLGVDEARFYICEIAAGINELHKRRILHRDLKPENILIDAAGHVAIADFGISVQFTEGQDPVCKARSGTMEFRAPETANSQTGHTYTADWWGLGCVAFKMLTKKTAHWERTLENPRFPNGFDNVARDFVLRLLTKNPARRLGCNGGLEEVKMHAFLNGVHWDEVTSRRAIPPFLPDTESGKFIKNPAASHATDSASASPCGSKRKLETTTEISAKKPCLEVECEVNVAKRKITLETEEVPDPKKRKVDAPAALPSTSKGVPLVVAGSDNSGKTSRKRKCPFDENLVNKKFATIRGTMTTPLLATSKLVQSTRHKSAPS